MLNSTFQEAEQLYNKRKFKKAAELYIKSAENYIFQANNVGQKKFSFFSKKELNDPINEKNKLKILAAQCYHRAGDSYCKRMDYLNCQIMYQKAAHLYNECNDVKNAELLLKLAKSYSNDKTSVESKLQDSASINFESSTEISIQITSDDEIKEINTEQQPTNTNFSNNPQTSTTFQEPVNKQNLSSQTDTFIEIEEEEDDEPEQTFCKRQEQEITPIRKAVRFLASDHYLELLFVQKHLKATVNSLLFENDSNLGDGKEDISLSFIKEDNEKTPLKKSDKIPSYDEPTSIQNNSTPIILEGNTITPTQNFGLRFLEGARFYVGTVWPLVFTTGLFSTDLWKYLFSPSTRYGNTFGELVLGRSDTGEIYSSLLGNDLPNQVGFTVPWLLTSIVPIVAFGLFHAILHRHDVIKKEELETELNKLLKMLKKEIKKAENAKLPSDDRWLELNAFLHWASPFSGLRRAISTAGFLVRWDNRPCEQQHNLLIDKLRQLAKHHGFGVRAMAMHTLMEIQRTYPGLRDEMVYLGLDDVLAEKPSTLLKTYRSYLRWSRGHKINHRFAWGAEIGFGLFLSYLYFAALRFLMMNAYKSEKGIEYLHQKSICEAQEKEYDYLKNKGNNDCVVCDYDNVSDKDKASTQKCLDGLLKSGKPPAEILKEQKRLMRHNDFSILDGSQINWPDWTNEEFGQFLGNITAPRIELFKIPSPIYVPVPSKGQAKLLGEFMQNTPTETLDISNRNLGDPLIKLLFPSPTPHLTTLIMPYNAAGDESAGVIANNLPNVVKLNLQGNFIGAPGIQAIVNKLSLVELDLRDTGLTKEGLEVLLNATGFMKNLKVLRLGGNTLLSGVNWPNAMDKLKGSGVRVLDLARIGLSDPAVKAIASGLTGTQIEDLDLSHNHFSNSGFISVWQIPKTAALRRVTFDGNPIKNDGLEFVASELMSKSGITHVGLSSLSNVQDGLVAFVKATNSSSVVSLVIQDNGLDDDKFVEMANYTLLLTHLDGSGNPLTDRSGTALAATLPRSSLNSIVLSHTFVTDVTLNATAEVLVQSKVETIIIRHAKLGGKGGLPAIGRVLDKSQAKLIDFSFNNITDEEGQEFVVDTIKNVPNWQEIGIKYNIFQTRYIGEHGLPSSCLKFANLDNNLTGNKTKNAIGLTRDVTGIHFGEVPENTANKNETVCINVIKEVEGIYFNKEKRDKLSLKSIGFFRGAKPIETSRTWIQQLPSAASSMATGFLTTALGLLSSSGSSSSVPQQRTTAGTSFDPHSSKRPTVDPTATILILMFAFGVLYYLYNYVLAPALNNHDENTHELNI